MTGSVLLDCLSPSLPSSPSLHGLPSQSGSPSSHLTTSSACGQIPQVCRSALGSDEHEVMQLGGPLPSPRRPPSTYTAADAPILIGAFLGPWGQACQDRLVYSGHSKQKKKFLGYGMVSIFSKPGSGIQKLLSIYKQECLGKDSLWRKRGSKDD